MSDAQEAVQKTTEAAQVVDKIAEHLGNAAGNLAAKFTTILEQHGPDAVRLIGEVGRIQAFSQVGNFLLIAVLFTVFFTVFMRYWARMEKYLQEVREDYGTRYGDLHASLTIRMVIFGFLSFFTLVGTIKTFSLAAIYGLFSPEAFLVIKLLNWN